MKSLVKVFLSLGIFLHFSGVNAQNYIDYMRVSGNRNLSDIQIYMETNFKNDTSRSGQKNLKFFNRWKHTVESRLDQKGNIFNHSSHNYNEMQRFLNNVPKNANARNVNPNLHGDWNNVTPGQTDINESANGRINCIAIHPTDPNIIYVGTPVGGIWVSYNGGSSWLNLNPGMDNLGVSDIVINHSNPNELFIITGDGNALQSPSMGIFKSTNGGYDWSRTSLFWEDNELVYGYKLLMHPTDPNKMYVATTKGLYLTNDKWTTFQRRLDDENLRDIEFETSSPSTLYASSVKEVFKSNNNGFFWQEITDISTGLTQSEDWNRIEIAVTPDQPGLVYILYAQDNPSSGSWGYYELYKSSDFGQSFSLQSGEGGLVSNQSFFNLALSIEPGNPTTIYLGTVLLFKSTDSGESFPDVIGHRGTHKIHQDVHALEWSNNSLFTGTDGGISKSTNGGNTFTNLSDGLTIQQFYDIDVKRNLILGGTQDNGVWYWGTNDHQMLSLISADGLDCFFHPSENGMFFSTQLERYRKFFGSGRIKITPNGQEGDIWGGPFTMHPHNPDTIYSAVYTFARSYNRGDHWDIFDPGFIEDNRMNAMAQGINDSDWIYISNGEEIRRTTDAHAAIPLWINITNNLPLDESVRIGEIIVNPENSNEVWVSLVGYGDGNKVFYSDSGGIGLNAWTNISFNLPNVPVYSIEYLPGSDDGIYVGTDFGVFYKDNSMNEWIWFSNGLPKTRIEDMIVKDDYLYAATFGLGVWRTSNVGICPDSLLLNAANDPSPSHSTGTQLHTAKYSIVSDRVITGGFGSHVTYSAGNSIVLLPGFHAEYNNEFRAYIGGCPD